MYGGHRSGPNKKTTKVDPNEDKAYSLEKEWTVMTDLKEIFEARRSVNFFQARKELAPGVLEQIIDLASLAPSAFNLQPWELIAVKSEEAKKRLYPLAFNQPKILEAPVILIVIGDRKGYEPGNPEWNELETMLGGDKEALAGTQQFARALYGATPEREIKFAESNAGLLAASILYAAQYYGVDSHAMSGMDFEGVKKEFAIDGGKEVVMLIALGYFDDAKTLYPRRHRKGYREMVREV